jgi:mono/diheme cytochrome c family protein
MQPPRLQSQSSRLLRAIAIALVMQVPPATAGETAAAADAPSPDLAARGRGLYLSHCMRCHGPNMITPGTIAYDLRKFPADQKDRFVLSVLNGKGAMPAWGGAVTGDDIDALWAYVLTRGK